MLRISKVTAAGLAMLMSLLSPCRPGAADLADWAHSGYLYLDTSPGGADVTGTVTRFPILVRLDAANFDFSQARGDGRDLRFTTPSGDSLPRRIERWDSARAEAAGEKTFVNPRNATSGTLKQLDPAIPAGRPLQVLCYQLVEARRRFGIARQIDIVAALREAGLPTNHAERVEGIEAVLGKVAEWDVRRRELPFDVDGLVVKLDDLRAQEDLGATSKSPRWAIAARATSGSRVSMARFASSFSIVARCSELSSRITRLGISSR